MTSCVGRGIAFSSTSDSEIIGALIATDPAEALEDAIANVLPRLQGAFSTVVMTKDRVVAFRDPQGVRPLVLGELPAGTQAAESDRARPGARRLLRARASPALSTSSAPATCARSSRARS